eukprot:1180088-Prorocentrum_minimum.AAC.2
MHSTPQMTTFNSTKRHYEMRAPPRGARPSHLSLPEGAPGPPRTPPPAPGSPQRPPCDAAWRRPAPAASSDAPGNVTHTKETPRQLSGAVGFGPSDVRTNHRRGGGIYPA